MATLFYFWVLGTDPVEKTYTGKSVSLGSQPKMIAALEDGVIAVTTQEVGLICTNIIIRYRNILNI